MKDYLVLVLLALVVVVSGCTQSEDVRPSNSTNNTPDAADEAREEMKDTGEPNISVVSLESSKDQYIFDENVSLTITFKNSGGEGDTIRSGIEYAYGRFNYSGFEYIPDMPVEAQVPAGETVEITKSFSWAAVEDLKFRFKDKTTKVEVLAKNLSIGESHTTVDGEDRLSVEEFEMKETLEKEGGGTLEPEEPWNNKFIVMKIEQTNLADRNISYSLGNSMGVYTNKNMTDYSTDTWLTGAAKNYRDFPDDEVIEPEETMTEWVTFEIPNDTKREDVAFRYEANNGKQKVYWRQ